MDKLEIILNSLLAVLHKEPLVFVVTLYFVFTGFALKVVLQVVKTLSNQGRRW